MLLAALAACRGGAPSAPPDPVILALGDQVVRRSDFERHLEALKGRGLEAGDASVRRAVLDAFLEERVLVLEAQNRGLLKPGGSSEEGEAAAQQLLAEAAGNAPGVGDDEIATYYAAHQAELRVPETIVLRQILVPTENEARDVRRRLAKEPKSFEMLAQTRSHAPEASQGGLMGRFARGQLPADLEPAAFALAAASASDPVKTALGYHVLRVDSREAARDRTLDECRNEIRALIQRQKADEAARQLVRGLLAKAKVNYEAAQVVADAR